MKARILPIVACVSILFWGVSRGQNSTVENSLKAVNIRGNVRSISQKAYQVLVDDSGKIAKGKQVFSEENIWYYDTDGRLQESIRKIADTTQERWLYTYNEKGMLKEDSKYNSIGELQIKTFHHYNQDENLVERNICKYREDLEERRTFSYNDKGLCIEKSEFYPDGSLLERRTYNYNAKGYKTSESIYGKDNELARKHNYKIDSKGNTVQETTHMPNGNLIRKYIYKYDDKRNIIGESIYESDRTLTSKIIAKCKYDDAGNWIEQIVQDEKGTPLQIVERKIEYYQ